MTRHGLARVAALAAALGVPSITLAYFPPDIGMPKPPVQAQSLPPDPFKPPTTTGQGEPDAPPPPHGPTVQTPEPATMVTAMTGAVLAAGYGLRKRRQAAAA